MRTIHKKTLPVLLFFLLNNLSARTVIDAVVAVVNGEPITLSDMRAAMPSVLEKKDWDKVNRSEKEDLLNELINRKLLIAESERLGITADEREINRAIEEVLNANSMTKTELQQRLREKGIIWEEYIEEIRHQIIKGKALQRIIFPKIGERTEELQRFYSAHKDKFKKEESVHLLHIFLPMDRASEESVRKKSYDIYNSIKTKEDFMNMAKIYSDGPAAKEGGDIGFINKGELIPELEQKVFSASQDKRIPPIKTSRGYHLFYVLERKPAELKTFDEALPEVKELFFKDSAETLYNEWMNKLRGRYIVRTIPVEF